MTDQTDQIALDAAGEVTLPVADVLTGRSFVTGKAGSGKSNSVSVIVEELLERGFPVFIVDIEGEYWGLKEQYEVLHVGADEECDLKVGPEHAEKLAELALEQNVPIILDISGYLDADEADALVRESARHLFAKEKKLKKPFLLIVEEIHEYIPEGGGLDETGEMLVRVAKRGRKRGLGTIGVSQRPADVKKDFITQCDWLLWHRLTWENDTNVVRRVVGSEYADAVPDLADGEGFLMADFIEEDVVRVQVRRKETFDAGATPDLGEFERPELKSVSGDLVGELEEITEREERRQDRIAELERRLEEKEDTIDELHDELEQARDLSDMAQQFTTALTSTQGGEAGEALQQQMDEIREEKNARIRELEDENEALRDDLREARERVQSLSERVSELEQYEQAVENLDELREAVTRMNDALGIATGDPDERLRKKVQSLQDDLEDARVENEQLRERVEEAGGVTVPSDYQDFVNEPVVRNAIEDAKANASCSPRYVKGVIATILEEGGAVDYETIATYLGVSTTTDVSKAASALSSRGVVKKVQNSPAIIDFDMDSIAEIKARNQRRDRAQNIMENL